MKRRYRTRRHFSAGERQELWKRWRGGELMADIARALSRDETAVRARLLSTGGFSPRERTRCPRHLSEQEREHVSRCLTLGKSYRRIAAELKRAPSTVSREVARNGGRADYRCVQAEARALAQARRPKRCKLVTHARLRRVTAEKLRRLWSPQQISEWLKLQSSETGMQISHEAIYQSLFIQTRGALKAELRDCLRTMRRMRQGKPARKEQRRGQIPGAISISERPAVVEDRAVPGHWEGDLLAGTQTSFIATLVERKTRFVLLVKVDSKETDVVIDALIREMKKLPVELRRSVTLDRGSEFAQHARFAVATDLKVYFCDPQSPWQRGSNENTNGLLRQYFPKGEDVSHYSQADLNRIARELNTRPRQTLGFRTPADMLNEALR
jgi:IS30 family transposase